MPGLLKRERSLILPMALASMVLFALGAWAAYGYVVPLVVHVLDQFMTPSMKARDPRRRRCSASSTTSRWRAGWCASSRS